VREAGLEPARAEAHKILSLARLPVSPLPLLTSLGFVAFAPAQVKDFTRRRLETWYARLRGGFKEVAFSVEGLRPIAAGREVMRENRETLRRLGGLLDWRRGADSNRRIEVLQTSPLASWVPRRDLHNRSSREDRQPEVSPRQTRDERSSAGNALGRRADISDTCRR
jgi:hypothetical protein